MAHKVELLAVGEELLSGHTLNTNAQTLAQALGTLGLPVRFETVVGDEPHELSAALAVAQGRADILITIGGLGPTADDLTRETVAGYFGKKLEFHQEILSDIRAFYESALGLPMPENNRSQAYLPQGCTMLENPVGTAPGCAFEAEGIHVLMLPGPPRELAAMLPQALAYLRPLSEEVVVSHDLLTFGVGESAVEERLRRQLPPLEKVTLATYAKPAEVRVRLTARARSAAQAEALLAPVLSQVREILGEIVYGEDLSSLEEACLRLCKEAGLTLATAESCTGGEIAQRITALPGASQVYRGGVVSYWSSVKAQVLGVPEALLEEFGAVSEPVARAMCEGARAITGADLAVSVTGVAGPDSDERGNPVGLVFVGLASAEKTYCHRLELGPHRRDRIRAVAANHALDMVRRLLTHCQL